MFATTPIFVVSLLLVAAAPLLAFTATDCSEVPGCLNEYEWKHEATPAEATTFCKERYPTCQNIDARDMKLYCKQVLPLCQLFVYGYIGMTTEGHEEADAYCTKRMPRCYSKKQ
ncbi:hypothetical protein FOCC_FOCC002081 [Frankliniella occidentalis]|uniref:Uncharacterized protein LOC113210481 n=1 Tax=Frankliniella occidentalis TaxID=133901 RepID=A0A9C6U1R1_FRAOC|nr:uncharacterized protein LOC113210481 [Frankliniella occidentalis]KAE8751253.1 hypothetical protein FOCC_FOCC002081 [Frankliniella occidentalis]